MTDTPLAGIGADAGLGKTGFLAGTAVIAPGAAGAVDGTEAVAGAGAVSRAGCDAHEASIAAAVSANAGERRLLALLASIRAQEFKEILQHQRFAEKKSLAQGNTLQDQPSYLRRVFDAFGDRNKAQRLGHGDDVHDHLARRRLHANGADERFVDLQNVELTGKSKLTDSTSAFARFGYHENDQTLGTPLSTGATLTLETEIDMAWVVLVTPSLTTTLKV